MKNQLLSLTSLTSNSIHPDYAHPFVPVDLVEKLNCLPSNYYTVDFAEKDDGKWIILETGDGQVSSIAPQQKALEYYTDMRSILYVEDKL